jgi:23S rRNA pseudouridine1911/1915/1917 synthase
MDPLFITIRESLIRARLDKALAGDCDLSRSYVQQLIADGNVFLEDGSGAPATNPTTKTHAGQTYRIVIPDVTPLALEPVPMALDVVYEDDQLLVINKPAGLTVHPAPSTTDPTLVHGLLAHCGETLSGIGGVARPGIVHRLDKDTSGLMLVAKTDIAHQHLSAQLKDRSLSRTYDALCWGAPQPPKGVVDALIGRHPKDRIKMAVVSKGGKDARTHYETLACFRISAHIRCKLETGRTHQIRVHLNHIGHGLIGDPVYGQNTEKRLKQLGLTELSIDLPRQALHATEIRFMHPTQACEHRYAAPMPQDMEALMATLSAM